MKNTKMKTVKLALMALAMSFGVTVSASNKVTPEKENNSENGQKTLSSNVDLVKESNILFKKGKIIELAYLSIKGGEEHKLQSEYFAKIMPIASKYGGKILGSFQVTAITGGEITPQTVVIFEWPTIASRDELLANKEAQKLFPIRNAALTFGQVAYFTVKKDVTVTFREDKVYEFFNAWLTLDAENGLPEYFEKSDAPKKRYGAPMFLVSLHPVKDAYVGKGAFYIHPHMSGIVEWNNTAEFYGLTADPEFKEAKPFLDKSVSRLDMIHTRINFSQ